MSGEEEDIHSPDDQTLVTTIPVTTVLTPTDAPLTRESRYEYELLHETETCPQRIEEELGWEERLAHLEGLQDRLIQTVEET
ncbi:UNVERIFIED_CONTAM: hypothetical protein K2H54_002179 [Gekko kuhli]